MRRKLFTLASVPSLLLFAAAIVLWVRSYIVGDQIYWPASNVATDHTWASDRAVCSGRGKLGYYEASRMVTPGTRTGNISLGPGVTMTVTVRSDSVTMDQKGRGWKRFDGPAAVFRSALPPVPPTPAPLGYAATSSSGWSKLGFTFGSERGSALLGLVTVRNRLIIIPYWSLALATLALPLCWTVRPIRDVLRRRRGLCVRCGYDLRGSPDRCPECGMPVDLRGRAAE